MVLVYKIDCNTDYSFAVLILVMFSLAVFSLSVGVTAGVSLGDGLWRTFGHQTALPLTASEAQSAGWVNVTDCNPDLGILYAQAASGVSEKHPLGLYFNAAGQVAGVQATVYGTSRKVGNAAPDNIVKEGFWKEDGDETWHMDVSFRPPSEMCSSSKSDNLNGDRVVINQDTIKHSVPLTAGEAQDGDWTQGSCMSVRNSVSFKVRCINAFLLLLLL